MHLPNLNFAKRLWHALQRKAPAWTESFLLPTFLQLKDLVLLLFHPKFPTKSYSGPPPGAGPAVIGINLKPAMGLPPQLRKHWPMEHACADTPIWKLRTLTRSASPDLVAAEGPALLLGSLPRDHALMLPKYLWHSVDVTGEWDDVCQRFHDSVRRNELRWYRKYGYQFDTTRNRGDLEHFIGKMHLPTVEARHGLNSLSGNRIRMEEQFENGLLVRIFKDGSWVAGALCEIMANDLHFCELGVLDSSTTLIKQGVMSAIYIAAIRQANSMKCRWIHLTNSSPFLSHGLFQYKRKWGTCVKRPLFDQKRIWIKIQRHTPAVHALLTASPMATVDRRGRLHGLIALDRLQDWNEASSLHWRRHFHVEGLNSIRVLPLDRFKSTGVLSVVAVESLGP